MHKWYLAEQWALKQNLQTNCVTDFKEWMNYLAIVKLIFSIIEHPSTVATGLKWAFKSSGMKK